MSKSKKRTPNKSKKGSKDIDFVLMIVITLVILLLYYWLFDILTMKIYTPYYFVSTKTSIVYFMGVMFYVSVILSFGFLIKKKKFKKKKIVHVIIFPLITLFLMITISGNVWVFNENSISFNNLFQKNQITYSYADIEKAEMSISYKTIRFNHTFSIEYILYMDSGKKIKFDAYESFREDDDKLIEFDKTIANKRAVVGEFLYIDSSSKEFNDYYHSLFVNTGDESLC